MLVKRAILVTDKRRFHIKSRHSAKSTKISTCRNSLPDRFWLPICFQDELGYTRMVRMNWDFVAILKLSQSGTNRRLWEPRGYSRKRQKDTQRQRQRQRHRCTETGTAIRERRNGNGRTATEWWKPGLKACFHYGCAAIVTDSER